MTVKKVGGAAHPKMNLTRPPQLDWLYSCLKMGWGQSKESGAIEESQSQKLEKPMKRSLRVHVEQSERATQGSSAVVETSVDYETAKMRVPTVNIDTSEPHTITTIQSLPLSRQGEATDTAESDDKKLRGTQEDSESCLEIAQPPVQPVDIVRPSEATATPPAIGTVSGRHCKEQTVVEAEEKKLSIVADTAKSHSTATEASRKDDKEHKGTSEDSQQGPRAQDESDHVSKKPVPVRKKRHKRTRHHGE